jgi:nitrogen fixation protein NifZ
MMDVRQPKYDWGQRVKVLVDLLNDGSFPEKDEDAVLAPAGTMGEIVQVGMHSESNTPIYLVEFSEDCVVGCLEDEISPL